MSAIFGMHGIFGDGVGLDARQRDGGRGSGDRGSDRELREGESEGLIDGFRGGDSGRGDEGDGDGVTRQTPFFFSLSFLFLFPFSHLHLQGPFTTTSST